MILCSSAIDEDENQQLGIQRNGRSDHTHVAELHNHKEFEDDP